MVWGWRRAFCTSISKDQGPDSPTTGPTARSGASRFGGIFSNPSTPRLGSAFGLRCRTAVDKVGGNGNSPKLEFETRSTGSARSVNRSAPTSPRSPSTFSLLRSGLRLSRSRCGICLQRVKTDQGTAIFTAECGHSFHFPCISAHVKKQASLACPVCGFTWKELHLLSENYRNQGPKAAAGDAALGREKRSGLKVYDDDEPLYTPTSGRFQSIPESDETEEECDGTSRFSAADNAIAAMARSVDVALSSEAVVVSVGKTSETYAIFLKLRAPVAPPARRVPIDLVTVLNVSRTITAEKIQFMKKVMRMVVSSLSADDRLSIVAFSTASKRLTPLRGMNPAGRRSARRIIDAVVSLDGCAANATDSLKKAAKVIEDRREKNPASSILLFTDGHRRGPLVSSTRFSRLDIPVHYVNLSACSLLPADDFFKERISGLLSETVHDLRILLCPAAGSAPVDISAVYAFTGKPALLGSGSKPCWIGALHSEEERELLIELKVPSSSSGGARRLLAVRCSYTDPSTQQTIHDKERHLPVPRPRAVGASTREMQRLRCLFVTTRAVAESRVLVERNDVAGAKRMLAAARALVLQSGSGAGEEFVRGLEAELNAVRQKSHNAAEPLTPTSAWRAAERLAKVAIMRKSRVSDLHGFENAGF